MSEKYEVRPVTLYLEFPRIRCPYCQSGDLELRDTNFDFRDFSWIHETWRCEVCNRTFTVELDTTTRSFNE